MRGAGGGAYGFLKRECLQKSSHIGPDEPGLKDEIVSESDQLVVKLRLRLAEIEAIPYTNDFNQPCTDGCEYPLFLSTSLSSPVFGRF